MAVVHSGERLRGRIKKTAIIDYNCRPCPPDDDLLFLAIFFLGGLERLQALIR